MYKNIKVIGFDADDTLWVNEPFFRNSELDFCNLLLDFAPKEHIIQTLFKIEMQNLKLYGYGTKSFMLSMFETITYYAGDSISTHILQKVIEIGKKQIQKPVELLKGVPDVLKELSKNYKLVLATKGDLIDQQRKLEKSGLSKFFDYVEVMIDKQSENYLRLINNLNIQSSEFLMVGNSIKSDIIPVIELGGAAIQIPFHTTWIHEEVDNFEGGDRFCQIESVEKLSNLLSKN